MRKLYGGAIVADIPSRFIDISMFREVPDNQEVYADVDTDESVIVELLELDDSLGNDVAPIAFMSDVAKANDCAIDNPEECRVIERVALDLGNMRAFGAAEANDCAIDNPEECRVIERVALDLGNMRAFGAAEATLLVCCQNVAKFKESARNAVVVYMVSVRIPKFHTDMLISVNAPISITMGSSSSFSTVKLPDQKEARELAISVAKSLKIVDKSLFG